MTENCYEINENKIEDFLTYQKEQERSRATLQKYRHDLMELIKFLKEEKLTKSALINWKEHLMSAYAPASVNAMLAAANGYLRYEGWIELTVKPVKIQKSLFLEEEKELTQKEYIRLVKAAKRKENERRVYGIHMLYLRFSEKLTRFVLAFCPYFLLFCS